jgi:hypothetical protein
MHHLAKSRVISLRLRAVNGVDDFTRSNQACSLVHKLVSKFPEINRMLITDALAPQANFGRSAVTPVADQRKDPPPPAASGRPVPKAPNEDPVRAAGGVKAGDGQPARHAGSGGGPRTGAPGGRVPLRDEGETEAALQQRPDCIDAAGRFMDPDFGPTAASLFLDPAAPPAGHPSFDAVRFLRPHEFARHGAPSLFGAAGTCGAVAQGAVADGWFLSALCAVATRRDLLDVILPHHAAGVAATGAGPERGIYTVRFYKYGQVRTVRWADG